MLYREYLEKLKSVKVSGLSLDTEINILEFDPKSLDWDIDKAEAGLLIGGLQEDLIAYFTNVEKMIVELAKELDFNLVEFEVVKKG